MPTQQSHLTYHAGEEVETRIHVGGHDGSAPSGTLYFGDVLGPYIHCPDPEQWEQIAAAAQATGIALRLAQADHAALAAVDAA